MRKTLSPPRTGWSGRRACRPPREAVQAPALPHYPPQWDKTLRTNLSCLVTCCKQETSCGPLGVILSRDPVVLILFFPANRDFFQSGFVKSRPSLGRNMSLSVSFKVNSV